MNHRLASDRPRSNVAEEPCSRSDWHTHPLGQILIVTFGRGYVQQYRTGAVKRIYNRWFSDVGPPPPVLDSLYDLNGLRD